MDLYTRKWVAINVVAGLVLTSGIGVMGAPAFAATAKTVHHQQRKEKKALHKQVSAEALLKELSINSNNIRYSQANIHQTETISVAGQVKTIHLTETFQTERTGSNTMVLGTVSTSVPGIAARQQLFINHNKMYMKSGKTPWVLMGSINSAKLSQLTQTINYMFQKVTMEHLKYSEVFHATLNPLTFSSMVQQGLSVYTPSSSMPAMPANLAKAMAIMFQHVQANLIVIAHNVQGAERVASEKVTMTMAIPAKGMQTIATLVHPTQSTVTSSVYGPGNPIAMPAGAMKLSLWETVNFTYGKTSIHVPVGIPAK